MTTAPSTLLVERYPPLLLGVPSELFLPVAFSDSLILGNKELAVHLKMTRRRMYWVPRSSGGLVNLGLDVDDDMVSGLSYVSRSLLYQNTRKQFTGYFQWS